LNALPRGLYADNLWGIAKLAKGIAGRERHNVATWALIYLGFNALADYWDVGPVNVEAVATFERQLQLACEAAIVAPSAYAVENLAREIVRAIAHLNSDSSG
jgi:hypothetical protein